MSGRKSKKNQRLGSSRRGPKGLNRNIEKDDDDDGFQQIAVSEDGRNDFHTSTDYHSTQFDHPPSSSIDQQTSPLESLPHDKDSLMETELPERKRKMGSTRKSAGRFKVERKLDEVRTTEEFEEEYVTRPNTSTTEEQHEEEQSRPMSFPSDLSHSSGLGKEPGTTPMFVVSENEEKDAIHRQEITSHSHEVVNNMPINEAMGTSVHSFAVTAESDSLQKDSVMFDEPKTLCRQEIATASTSGQKRRMGSTRRPLGGKNSVQEHSRNMTENERKAEVMGETKLKMSEEMVQAWDDVARDDPSSHTVSALVSNQTLLAEKAELKETDISSGTETMNQTVAFPLVDSEKPLPETSHHYGTSLLNEELDFKFGSHTDDLDVLNKDAGSDNSYVPDTRKDTNPSYDFRDVNTETKEEVLKQKGELSINDQMSSLLPKQDTRLEELALNDQESSLSQHDLDNNCNSSVPQLIVGGSGSFDVPLSNISHDEPTATNLPHEMSDAVEERREIHIEKEQGNNLCNVAAVACDTPTDLESITEEDEEPQNLAMRENENMSDERGSETENAFEMTGQDDARDHSVTQIIMDVRDNEKDGETITETIWISHQTVSEVSAEKEEIYREEVQYSSNISQTHSPQQDDAEKMLENDEVTNDKKETENTAVNDVTSKPEEMFSFEDSATDTGSHAHQLFMQSPFKEGCDLHERVSEKSEKKKIFFSVESENAPSDKGDGRSEGTEGIKEMDAAPVVILDVDTNDSESENPEQNRALTEEQNDTSSDTNLQVLQISDNVSSVIDSGLLFHDVIDVSLGERERVPEKSDISSFIPDDSQDFYKPTTFHPESQENTGDPESAAVGGDTDLHLEIEAQNKTFDLTSEAEGTEKNMQDASVLAREVEVIADTVTVESNMTTELDFLQSSPDVHVEALNLSEKAKKEVSGETDTILEQSNISSIPQDSHGEEAHSKSSPVIQKRKMGSTRRPLKGKKGQRQEHDEKEICNLGDEPSPDESTLRSSKDGAKEREVEICEEKDVEEVEVIGDKVTMLSIMTTESDFLQSSPDAHVEALDLFKNAGKEVSGETDTILKQSDINIIAEDSYGEEAHSKSSPVIHKRKMGSTRRPLKGNKGRRKEMEHQDENETLDSEGVISVEKETINLEDEPSPDESTLQSLKDGDKEQMEICENKDVGPVEGSESALLQSSCSSDLVSVKSTAISICHVTESRDLTKMNEESQENAGDVERVQADLQLKTYLQNETFDITTSEAEGTEENTQDVSFMLIREVKVIGDTVTVESNLTTETDFLQTSPDAHVEALEVSENAEKEVSGETDKILKQNDISIIPEDSHGEEAHSESSPIVHKRKMGSTRRPLKGKKGQRQEHDEKEICNLGDEPSPDESTLRSSKDEVKEQEVEICEKNDFGSVEGVESAVLQSSCNSDLAFEESTAISMENAGAAERVPGEEDKDLQLKIESENKTFDLTTSEAERTEENIQDVSVTLVREVEVIGDTVTVESNLTIESNFLQSSPDANIEALKLSENAKKEFSGETDTIAEQSNISSIPQDSHREEAHSKLSPVIHKRKMGSTRRPLKGNKGRRKEMEHQDENESLDSEGMISAEKETINLEDEPSPDESTLQCSKDGAKEQEVEICGHHLVQI
ncbi:hypothetical protein M9458_014131 [Cirrhinus mrigala]|uniref:Uncharacterized protein n=1 Tax=Cirrhinus mrigala TaxID=683832 RepID=A0ABD0R0H5_CIRMR